MKDISKRCTNAQEMQKEHPKSFEAPTKSELKRLKVDDFVKVCVDTCSRFWVQITKIDCDTIVGRIDNGLPEFEDLDYNNIVMFKDEHVYAIDFPDGSDYPK